MFKNPFENIKKAINRATDNVTPENSSIQEAQEYKKIKEKIEKENSDYFNNAA